MTRVLATAVIVASVAPAAYGHHSIAGVYDTRRDIAVEGVVTDFQFVSPHPFVFADVARTGVIERWRFDMDDRSEMREIGMTESTLRAGDRIAVAGNPAHEDPRRMYIRRLERPSDGYAWEIVRSSPRLRSRGATR
ncbi:MAG: hypothetical protein HW394_569 [Acidobacteria bacterium]|nr:hypothetical protein [Acidobacteriota bacterium]